MSATVRIRIAFALALAVGLDVGDLPLASAEIYDPKTGTFSPAARVAGRAVISGVVTDGWLKESPVEGKYIQITCDRSSDGCFRGTLDLLRRSGD